MTDKFDNAAALIAFFLGFLYGVLGGVPSLLMFWFLGQSWLHKMYGNTLFSVTFQGWVWVFYEFLAILPALGILSLVTYYRRKWSAILVFLVGIFLGTCCYIFTNIPL